MKKDQIQRILIPRDKVAGVVRRLLHSYNWDRESSRDTDTHLCYSRYKPVKYWFTDTILDYNIIRLSCDIYKISVSYQPKYLIPFIHKLCPAELSDLNDDYKPIYSHYYSTHGLGRIHGYHIRIVKQILSYNIHEKAW